MSARPTRRTVVTGLAAGALAAPAFRAPALAQGPARVVVVGGGFGGATCARALKRADPALSVTLVEANPRYICCPFSNAVIAGLRDLDKQAFGYDRVAAEGVALRFATATAVDAGTKTLTLNDGARLPWDRLVLSPGVELRYDALPGYTEEAAGRMPHAWKAGAQTALLRRQLEAMPENGLVVLSAPANPYRCPPGPYERASLIVHFLTTRKPRAKLILLDSKDVFSKQKLFQNAWAALYPGRLEWVGQSAGGTVTSVDAGAMTVSTDFETYRPDVACIIPPQKAGRIAELAGVTDRSGWAPIHPATFESALQPGVHVIGDAAVMGAAPKSAFSANAAAKLCAVAVIRLLQGEQPAEPRLVNTCYSLVTPDYGISIAGVYRPVGAVFADIEGAGGVSPLEAPRDFRAAEAAEAETWFATITMETFG